MIPAKSTTQPVLIDFDLAGEISNEVTRYRVDHGPSGTWSYLPPEAIREAPITAKSDQYQLAVITYRMLSGESPFLESSSEDILTLMPTKSSACHQQQTKS